MSGQPYATKETIGEKTGLWLKGLEGSRGRRSAVRPGRCALVLIDLQKIFTDPSSPAFVPSWPAISVNVLKLVRIFSERKLPVVATRHIHRNSSGVIGNFFKRPLTASDPLSELDDFASRLSGDTQGIEKDTFAAFADGLPYSLEGVDVVIVCGVQTQRCVLATAIDLHRFGKTPIVLVDGCAAQDEERHLHALEILSDGHAHLATTDEVCLMINEGRLR